MDKRELAIFRATEAWKETAIEAVMDIEGWRDAADRRDQYAGDPSREWPKMPQDFYGKTAMVAAWVTSCYPNLAPAPLFDVYEAVLAWYTDHNASRIPPQAVLSSTLDRAVLVINAIEYGINIKHGYATEANPPETSGQADSKTDKRKNLLPRNPDVAKLALKIKRDLPKGGSKEDIALEYADNDAKKAASLLRQLRPDRYGHLLD